MKNYKFILLLCATIFGSTSVFAGDDEGGKKGIRAGWQSSTMTSNGSADSANAVNSFYVGLFGEKKLIPLLRLGYGLEYNSTGYKSNDKYFPISSEYSRHNLAIPIYLQVKLGPAFVLGGVAPNFAIGNKLKIAGEDIDMTDDFKLGKFDAPVFLGLGLKITIISLEARYHFGTMDISNSDISDIKQGYLQVGAAVSF